MRRICADVFEGVLTLDSLKTFLRKELYAEKETFEDLYCLWVAEV